MVRRRRGTITRRFSTIASTDGNGGQSLESSIPRSELGSTESRYHLVTPREAVNPESLAWALGACLSSQELGGIANKLPWWPLGGGPLTWG